MGEAAAAGEEEEVRGATAFRREGAATSVRRGFAADRVLAKNAAATALASYGPDVE